MNRCETINTEERDKKERDETPNTVDGYPSRTLKKVTANKKVK